MTEVGMANSSVMFLNQDSQVPISTHPAHAHKHVAAQPVPKKYQSATKNKVREQRKLYQFAYHIILTIMIVISSALALERILLREFVLHSKVYVLIV
jgi:hypothetical protein